jgi:glycosyltransferase involved in cell wall biosynthesis
MVASRQRRDGRRARLGVYADTIYSASTIDGMSRFAADPIDFAFVLFVSELRHHVDSVHLFGRSREVPAVSEELLLASDVQIVGLPDYGSLTRFGEVARALTGTVLRFWRGLQLVDIVWVFGPHPFGVVLVVLAAMRRKAIVLGVRQDTLMYFRARAGRRRSSALAGVWAMDWLYRVFARRVKATVVGAEIARRYGAERTNVLNMTVSPVRLRDLQLDESETKSYEDTIEILTVGRVEPEKNPLLLVQALGDLDEHEPGRYRLAWVGTGQLTDQVRKRAADLGLSERIDLVGFVPFGPRLLDLYRKAHVFVHVAVTEGLPQVIVEAFACGVPVVATDVGGVRQLVKEGRTGLIVPPHDAEAVAAAVRRIVADHRLRSGCIEGGATVAQAATLEDEAGRVARFIVAGP